MKKDNNQEKEIKEVLKQLDEIEDFDAAMEIDKNPLEDAAKSVADSLSNLDRNYKIKKDKSSKWPGYNPIKPNGWKDKNRQNNSVIKEGNVQKPTAIVAVENQVLTGEEGKRKIQNQVLKANNLEVFRDKENQFGNVLKDSSEEIVKLLNNIIQHKAGKKEPNQSRKILRKGQAMVKHIEKSPKPIKRDINIIRNDSFQQEDIELENNFNLFNDNTLDVDSLPVPNTPVIDTDVEEKTNEEEIRERDINDTSKKTKNKYMGKNPWIKKCIKEIDKTDKQITALVIAKQFMDEKPRELEGAKKINVVYCGDKYVLQVITDSKEAKTYEISEREWENRKQGELIFENKEPQNKKIMSMKKVLRVDKDNVEGELEKLGEYKDGLEYMKEKLEPINSKRKWKTLKLRRSITTGENKEKLEDKKEFKEIRHNVEAINSKFSIHKNRKHERNKEDIINKYGEKKHNKDDGPMPTF